MQNFAKKIIVQNMHIIIMKIEKRNYIVDSIKKMK